MNITEKVSFNIASEASYVYILSKQKFIKNAIITFASFWKPEPRKDKKLAKMSKFKCDILSHF